MPRHPYMGGMSHERKTGLRLASWNIRAGLGTDWRRDPLRVLRAIAGFGADVVVLQEADFRTGDRPSALPRGMIEEHTGLVPLAVGVNAVSLGWHGNAILARPGLHLAGLLRLDLPGLEPRGALIVDLEGAASLRVVAVHLGLLRQSRKRQTAAITQALHSRGARPTVILGDFNERSGSRGLGGIARGHRLLSPGPTYPSLRPFLPLDRIAHSPDLAVDLLPLPQPWPHRASDHLPVLADLGWE
jgi:endonuclease/exonuclease/phosphatase family metal-dependent hydrolase